MHKNKATPVDEVRLLTAEEAAPVTEVIAHLPDAAQAEEKINYSDQSTWLLGYFPLSALKTYPHSRYFIEGSETYVPDGAAVEKLKNTDWTAIKIKVVMGSWCPDSRKRVPHFFKVLSLCGYPEGKVELIGVDNTKFSPIENFNDLGIVRVPTFIFYKNNIEAGRIIENPVTSLEQDMVNILNRNE
jgi:hypothetical protein